MFTRILPKPKKAKRNRKLLIDPVLECPEFEKLRKSKDFCMHTTRNEATNVRLGYPNSFCDYRDHKIEDAWFGLEYQTVRQMFSSPLITIHDDIRRKMDFTG